LRVSSFSSSPSGATDHITSELEKLTTHEKYHGGDHVNAANDSDMEISHVGRCTLQSPPHKIHLNNILHVPSMLTVNFRQPIHEFTIGVGMNFISYPLVITPWYNKFICACRFWSLVFIQDFNVESKTFGISSLSTS
jgi:hypothetical protein